MTDLTPAINAAITLLAALLTAFLIPWLKRRTSAQDREELLRWVEIAVAAAEQIWGSAQGEEKKIMKRLLKQHCVKRMKNWAYLPHKLEYLVIQILY